MGQTAVLAVSLVIITQLLAVAMVEGEPYRPSSYYRRRDGATDKAEYKNVNKARAAENNDEDSGGEKPGVTKTENVTGGETRSENAEAGEEVKSKSNAKTVEKDGKKAIKENVRPKDLNDDTLGDRGEDKPRASENIEDTDEREEETELEDNARYEEGDEGSERNDVNLESAATLKAGGQPPRKANLIPSNPPMAGERLIRRNRKCGGKRLASYNWCKQCMCWHGQWYCSTTWCYDWPGEQEDPYDSRPPPAGPTGKVRRPGTRPRPAYHRRPSAARGHRRH